MKFQNVSFSQVKNKIKPIYLSLNQQFNGAFDILRIAGRNFGKQRAPEAAASMAYFTLFSLFPLIIVIISFASIVLKSQFVQDQVLEFVVQFLPVTPDLILNNIENVLDKRGTVGFLATLGLAWSATSMFNILALNIDRAWPDDKSHNMIERRFMGFVILIGVAILLVVFWFFRTLLEVDLITQLLSFFEIPVFETTLWGVITFVGPRFFRFLMFWILYQWIPKADVKPREALWGAVFTTTLTELLTLIMNWYLSSQWMRYELVYGSLGSIVALLLWIYFASFIIFLGAHISSAVAKTKRKKNFNDQWTDDGVESEGQLSH
jgi:membrane protein